MRYFIAFILMGLVVGCIDDGTAACKRALGECFDQDKSLDACSNEYNVCVSNASEVIKEEELVNVTVQQFEVRINLTNQTR